MIATSGALLAFSWRRLEKAGTFRRRLLATLAIAGSFIWVSEVAFNIRPYLHHWDFFHYYMGAKYFPELSYDQAYRCLVVADSESEPEPAGSMPNEDVRDLSTNLLTTTAALMSTSELCKNSFSPERWQAFKNDTYFMRSMVREIWPDRWERLRTDYGHNATPLWNAVARMLIPDSTLSKTQIALLTSLDFLLLGAAFFAIFRSFGFETFCFALIFFGTNEPARYGWTSAAFLRYDWLAGLVLGVCFLRKRKFGLGAAALVYSTMLRIYPAIVLGVLLLKAAVEKWRNFRLGVQDAVFRKMAAGSVIAVVVTLLIAVVGNGRSFNGFEAFVANSRKYVATPVSNHVGLATILKNDSEERLAPGYQELFEGIMARDEATRPQSPRALNELMWKDMRQKLYRDRIGWHYAGIGLFLVGLFFLQKKLSPWQLAIASVGVIPVIRDFNCYYMSMFLLFACFWNDRRAIVGWLCILAACTKIPGLIVPSVSVDLTYAMISAAVVLFVFAVFIMLLVSTPVVRADAES